MTSVTIPNSVTSIEAYAFNGCSGLTSVTILNPITSIGSFAFNECNCLMSIKVRVTDYTAFCNNTRKSSSKPITLIDEDGQEITRFVIPDDVTSIEQSAFYDCSGLTSVTIPNSVTSIGQSAFLNCSGLTSVTIPNSVTSIGRSAFKDCTSLESVTIGDGVQSIDGDVFGNHRPAKIIWLTYTPPSGYSGAAGRVNYVANDQYTQLANKIVYKFLSSIFEVDGVKYVPVSPSERTCDAIDYIYDEQVSEVSINPTASYQGINMKVLNVQPFMFYQNINLRKASIDIPGSISMYAFNGCKNLQTITLGNSITCIDEYAFSDCTNMASVIVGDGTETIGAHAFENCSNLTSATIGNSTRFIQQYAFSGCTLLPTITIPGSVRLIDDNAFNGCKSLKEIIVKANNTDRRTTSFDPTLVQLGGSKTITIDVAKDEELSFNYQSWQGSITISFLGKDIPHSGGTFKQIFNKDGKISITLKSSNKPRENSYCTITNMKLIESGSLLLGSNGNSPIFVDCPLDSVFIDRDLAYRSESTSGYSPFYNNKFLRSVVITNNGKELSDNEFFGCTNLQNVQIGDGVTTIGDKAFSGCSGLKSFSFGTNVSNIGKEAFSDCTALIQLISHAATPPICGSQALDDINKWTCKLTIPYGCLGAYQAANQWKEFFFIEEGEKPKGIDINEEIFPDENFRAFLKEQPYGEDGVITDEELNTITVIDVSNKKIQSLKGIESFTALSNLNCISNQLTSLDVSGCTALTELNCDVNQLKSLEVSGCTALTSLRCYNNQVTSLDVSKNTALTNLSCSYNQLTSLDVSKCTALTYLDCGYNQLTSLDVSNNTALGTLVCGNNQLTNLDVSKNTALTYLNCYKNQLTNLDVSKNTALTYLSCGNNQLTSLDVSKNIVLQNLYCYDNKIKGEAMDALVGSLPIRSSAEISVIDLSNSFEENVCTTIQVNIAKEKGWSVMAYTGQWLVDYNGSVPSGIQGITLDKNANMPIYDLNGRRLKEPRKGINIIDGKKVVVK